MQFTELWFTSIIIGFPSFIAFFKSPAKPIWNTIIYSTHQNPWNASGKINVVIAIPLRTIRHSLQNSVINSSEELKSRAHTGEDVNGALRWNHMNINKSSITQHSTYNYHTGKIIHLFQSKKLMHGVHTTIEVVR